MVGTWPRTTRPMTVAAAGSSASMRGEGGAGQAGHRQLVGDVRDDRRAHAHADAPHQPRRMGERRSGRDEPERCRGGGDEHGQAKLIDPAERQPSRAAAAHRGVGDAFSPTGRRPHRSSYPRRWRPGPCRSPADHGSQRTGGAGLRPWPLLDPGREQVYYLGDARGTQVRPALAPHASSGSNGTAIIALPRGPAAARARNRRRRMALIVARRRPGQVPARAARPHRKFCPVSRPSSPVRGWRPGSRPLPGSARPAWPAPPTRDGRRS